jgi:hypothetical protein
VLKARAEFVQMDYLEFTREGLKISATASSGCPAALSLGGPVVCCNKGSIIISLYTKEKLWSRTFAQTSRGVAASAASSLLEMERALAATPASDMSLVVPLTEAGSTFAYHL